MTGGASGGGVQHKAVQCLGDPLSAPLPEGAEAPAHGETPGKQRRYSVEQYIAMWEKENGREMTAAQKRTLDRGCIGITALNLDAVNPPLDEAYATFEKAKEAVDAKNAFLEQHKNETDPLTGAKYSDQKAFLFAKLFWSNQNSDREKRKNPHTDAYQPDAATDRIDMSNYRYRAQPGYINFDYGFWDEDSQCFWHANHAQPGMKVYQSTKEKFARGYVDFDRIIYCVGVAKHYNAPTAARRSN
jgi:hypothetical protein